MAWTDEGETTSETALVSLGQRFPSKMLCLVPAAPSPHSNVQKGDGKECGLKVEQEMELTPGSRGCRTETTVDLLAAS